MSDEMIKKRLWLSRYLKNKVRIERLQDKLILLEDRIKSVKTSNITGMPRGSYAITIDELLSDKGLLIERIKRLKARGNKYKKEIIKAIDTLDNDNCTELLEHWFINGHSPERISELMAYSLRYVYILYSKALNDVEIPGI